MQKLDDDGIWNCPILTILNSPISQGDSRQIWSGHVMKDITIFDNFLSDDLLQDTLKFIIPPSRNSPPSIERGNWQYTGSSYGASSGIGVTFWVMKLQHFTLFTNTILKVIESKSCKRFELLDVYANGQTIGQDGSWHVDNDEPDTYTFLLYMSYLPDIIDSTNYKMFGGCTKFKLNRMITDVEPITNRGVLFSSKVIHAGLGPKLANVLRVSIAYKLKEIM